MAAEYAFVFWDLARCRSRAWLRSSPRPCCQMCPTLSRSRSGPTTSKGRVGYLDYPVLDAAVFHAQPTSEARVVNFAQMDSASVGGLPSGHLTSSNEGMWVLFHHDSSAAPQTLQTASPVCGTKNFSSVRLYSAPQLHRTIGAILEICAGGTPDQPTCQPTGFVFAEQYESAP